MLVDIELFEGALHEELAAATTGNGGVEMLSSASKWRPEKRSSTTGFAFKDFTNSFFTVATARLGVDVTGPVWRLGTANDASNGFTSEYPLMMGVPVNRPHSARKRVGVGAGSGFCLHRGGKMSAGVRCRVYFLDKH